MTAMSNQADQLCWACLGHDEPPHDYGYDMPDVRARYDIPADHEEAEGDYDDYGESATITVTRRVISCAHCDIGSHVLHGYKAAMPGGKVWLAKTQDECERVIVAAFPGAIRDSDYLQDMRTRWREDGMNPSW